MFRIIMTALLSLAVGLLAACAGPEGVRFDAARPGGSAADPLKVRGFLFKPEGPGPFPAVVLLHTCGGVKSHIMQDWPSFFVKEGYVAFTVDSFGSRGLGRCPNSLIGRNADKPFKDAMNDLAGDAYGALDYLAGLPYVRKDRIAVAGYSLGGITIHFALLESGAQSAGGNSFRAGVSLYGPCAVADGKIRMPTLATSSIPLIEIIGEKDERIVRYCNELLPKDGSVRIEILPGTYHAFDQPQFQTMRSDAAGNPMLYSYGATQDAHELVGRFFDRHLEL